MARNIALTRINEFFSSNKNFGSSGYIDYKIGLNFSPTEVRELLDFYFSDCKRYNDVQKSLSLRMYRIMESEQNLIPVFLREKTYQNFDNLKKVDFLFEDRSGLIYKRPIHFYKHISEMIKSDEVTEKRNKGYFSYIPLSIRRVVNVFEILYEKYGTRNSFCDVGCGIGDKVYLAWLSGIFNICHGIEYERFTYSEGLTFFKDIMYGIKFLEGRYPEDIFLSKIAKDGFPRIFFDDAFNHNFKLYDTIYFYMPIRNMTLLYKLYNHVFDCLKPGSVIVENLGNTALAKFLAEKGENLINHSPYIFEKVNKNEVIGIHNVRKPRSNYDEKNIEKLLKLKIENAGDYY